MANFSVSGRRPPHPHPTDISLGENVIILSLSCFVSLVASARTTAILLVLQCRNELKNKDMCVFVGIPEHICQSVLGLPKKIWIPYSLPWLLLSRRLQICSAIKILFRRILISAPPCNIHSPLNRTCSSHLDQIGAIARRDMSGWGSEFNMLKGKWIGLLYVAPENILKSWAQW